MRAFLSTLLLASVLPAAAMAQVATYLDTGQTPESRAHDLVSRMTLEEKAGQSVNTAPAIPRLGVPAYDYWNEGLHGVARSGYATLFPQAIGMAATWDKPLLGNIGTVVSTEARAKYNEAVRNNVHSIYFGLTIWSPNVNIFRDPRWGRGQETYGEDPFLTGQLGLHFIGGLQGPDPLHPRAVATPKHFAVHSGPESDRHRFDVEPSPHDLWDTYLPQFRTAIVDGRANSIMCAYNAIDGKPACGSDLLLKTILRGDWKFTGFVTSDCGAVDDFFEKTAHRYSPDAEHASASAVLAGTDTNCGNTYKALPAAVRGGLLTEADIDRAIERLFVARFRLGLFDPPASVPYARIPFSQDRAPEHLALSLQASREAMVLLKNDGILPLDVTRYKTVAIVGPNAASLSALEGNYNAVPKNPQMPVDALRDALGAARVVYAQGAPYADGVPLPVPSTMFQQDGRPGLKAEYFAATPGAVDQAFSTAPVATRRDQQIDFDWNSAAPVAGVDQKAFAVRWTGEILPPQAGDLDLNVRLAHCYPCGDHEQFTLAIDGKPVSRYRTAGDEGRESTTPAFQLHFDDTRPHAFALTYTHDAPLYGGGLTLEWVPPAGLLQRQAAQTIASADLVLALVGLSPELEGEEMKIHVPGFSGGDRTDITLPASQLDLLRTIQASGKPTVTILLNGSALAIPEVQAHSNAILEAWYPGEFGGRAIADTLLGRSNPAGRLPVTFYNSVADLPDFRDYSMRNRTYRYFTGTPLYDFGYGLSYTHFAYTELKLSTGSLHAGSPLTAEVEIRNTGKLAGDEVAQCYLVPPAAGNGDLSPRLQLAGFERLHLAPGEHRVVRFTLTPRDLSEVDAQGTRSVQPGAYSLSVGGAQPGDPRAPTPAQTARFAIEGTAPIPH